MCWRPAAERRKSDELLDIEPTPDLSLWSKRSCWLQTAQYSVVLIAGSASRTGCMDQPIVIVVRCCSGTDTPGNTQYAPSSASHPTPACRSTVSIPVKVCIRILLHGRHGRAKQATLVAGRPGLFATTTDGGYTVFVSASDKIIMQPR